MGKLNSQGMKDIATAREERANSLRTLMAQPFDVRNAEQIAAVKKLVDDFECLTNQMFLYQGLSTGLIAWGGGLVVRYMLPVPSFVQAILDTVFYLGVSGHLFKNFAINDFYDRLVEMKSIYNWALKNGMLIYDGETNNTDKLNNPQIQRLLKAIAPFSDVEFMMAWPKVTEQNAQPSLGNIFGGLYNRFFSTAAVPSNGLKELQIQVETGGCAVSSLEGLHRAIQYFATDLEFRARVVKKLHEPVDALKANLPDVASHFKLA